MISPPRKTAFIEEAWYPALAVDGDRPLLAWRAFRTEAPPDEPERILAAHVNEEGIEEPVKAAEGIFHGPPRLACSGERRLLFAVRRGETGWPLVCWRLGNSLEPGGAEALSRPDAVVTSFAVTEDGAWAVWAEAGEAGRRITLAGTDVAGEAVVLAEGPVWTPALAGGEDGLPKVGWEEDGRIRLALIGEGGGIAGEQLVGLDGRRLGHPDLCTSNGGLLLVCCSNGTWGRRTERLNEDARVHLFRWSPPDGLEMLGGQPAGEVPVCTTSRFSEYRSETAQNRRLPVAPAVAADAAGGPIVFFRHYRDAQMNDWGWTLRVTRATGAGAGPPEHISRAPGYPDGQYVVVASEDGRLAAVTEARYPVVGRGFARREGTLPPGVALYRFGLETEDAAVPWTCGPAVSGRTPMGGRWRTLPSTWSGYKLIWADLHRHTWESRCAPEYDGDFRDHCRWGRDFEQLGSLAFTDHWFVHGCNGEHRASLSAAAVHREPGRFVPLFGVEVSWPSTGHVNIYSRDYGTMTSVARMWERCGADPAEALRFLYDNGLEGKVIMARHFHGRGFGEGPPQILHNPLAGDDVVEPVVEVFQTRGDCLKWYCHMLSAGQRKGAIGGSDHCRAPDRQTPGCLTGLWVEEITPGGIWEALRSRRCFATNGARIELRLALGGALMGGAARAGSPLRWEVRSEKTLRSVAVYRNGFRLRDIACDGAFSEAGAIPEPGPGEAAAVSYFIVARDEDGGMAVSSPVWIEADG